MMAALSAQAGRELDTNVVLAVLGKPVQPGESAPGINPGAATGSPESTP